MQTVSAAFVKKWFRLGVHGEASLRHHPERDSWIIFLSSETQPETNAYVACTRGHVREFKKLQTAVDTARAMGFQTMTLEYEAAELDAENL